MRWLRYCLEGLIYTVYKNVDTLGYEGIHGGYGFGKHNIDGERIMELAVSNNKGSAFLHIFFPIIMKFNVSFS